MADRTKQLEACKAAASSFESRLQTAATKEEALKTAISVAENLVKAIKLSSSVQEKKELKSKCEVIMNTADRIKKNDNWIPLAPPVRQNPKHEQVEQWAASVLPGSPSPQVSSAQSMSSTFADLSLNTAGDARATSGKSRVLSSTTLQTSQTAQGMVDLKNPNSGNFDTLVDLPTRDSNTLDTKPHSPLVGVPLKANSQVNENVKNGLSIAESPVVAPNIHQVSASPPMHIQSDEHHQGPSTASQSHVRKLAPPISTRKLTKKEQILLLKASVVNGFKCPPWDANPASSEFALGEGVEMFTDDRELDLSAYQYQFFGGWVRARQALPPPSLYPADRKSIGPLMGTYRSIDLVQDAATDCSVVASLCAGIARAERGHEQMFTSMIWPFDKNRGKPIISSNGKYVVRLNFNGCWRKIVIDDRLPVSNTHRLLHVIDRRNPALLWPALLEKAYLKVRGGYDFPGSNSCGDLWTLTGWIPEQVYLQETDTDPNQLWTRIYNSFLYGDVLVTLGTGKMSTRQERELGLEGQHSYVVLDMRETDHDRLLLIKNPWVEGKGWRGPRPSTAPVIDASSSSGLSGTGPDALSHGSTPTMEKPHPTTFWVGLEQVMQHFESLYLNWNPGLFKFRQDIHFEWKIENQHATGSCIEKHPQFSFWSEKAGVVYFVLSRHFRDAPEDTTTTSDSFNDGSIRPESQLYTSGEPLKGYMSIFLCNGNGYRHYIKDSYLESTPYVNTPQTLLKWDAVGGETYTIVIDQDELPASPYTFSLSAFSNSNMSLEPASHRYPIQKTEAGAWTKYTAGGSTSSPQYFDNPQYTLEVGERCSLAIMLTSTKHAHPLHVKLALGHGKRLYRLQSRDVLKDSGDHRGGCVLAEIKDLQPGLYTIICSLFEAGILGGYTLRVDSTKDAISLKPIPRDGAGLLAMKLAPACFGSKVNKIAAPLVPRRLASYTIVARFLKSMSPRTRPQDLGMQARSPLRLSVEMGRGPERRFLVASESGEYADSATVRTERMHLDPSIMAQGDLWLVLDRLSGPGGAIEEWYEVEMFTDMPQACSVGVWRSWDD